MAIVALQRRPAYRHRPCRVSGSTVVARAAGDPFFDAQDARRRCRSRGRSSRIRPTAPRRRARGCRASGRSTDPAPSAPTDRQATPATGSRPRENRCPSCPRPAADDLRGLRAICRDQAGAPSPESRADRPDHRGENAIVAPRGVVQGDTAGRLVQPAGDRHQLRRLGAAGEIGAGVPARRQLCRLMRDGPVPVKRQARPRRKTNGREIFASVSLDRVAADACQPPVISCGLRLSLLLAPCGRSGLAVRRDRRRLGGLGAFLNAGS